MPLPPTTPLPYTTQPFNGPILKETAYRHLVSSEVDALWPALGVESRPFVMPEEESERLGFRQGENAKVNQKYGGGWLGNLEALHQLHCLVSDLTKGNGSGLNLMMGMAEFAKASGVPQL